jgi:hypothetical protein
MGAPVALVWSGQLSDFDLWSPTLVCRGGQGWDTQGSVMSGVVAMVFVFLINSLRSLTWTMAWVV